MLRHRHRIVLLAAGALALISAGCGGGNASSNTSQAAGSSTQAGGMMSAHTGAQLSVVDPQQGAVVTANSVPTDVSISNFRVDCDLAGTANRMGVGHYHIELDHALVNMFCGPRARISLQNVPPGKHTLEFLAAENDHAEDMAAMKSVSFVYKPSQPLPEITPASLAGKPSVRIVSPTNGHTVSGSFDLRVVVKNFHLSCALFGKADLAGYGHWHANVDSATKGMMGMGTMLGMSCSKSFRVSLAGIKPGQHTFFAILEDNQHAPTPHAMASVTLTVR
jgi:hypothetical protein